MLTLYRWLLCLYPKKVRDDSGEEMASVFQEARTALPPATLARVSFYKREFCGLIAGALCAHFARLFGSGIPLRRFDMQPQFRFPRSTIFLMWVILAGVLLVIAEAKNIAMQYGSREMRSVWSMLPWFMAVALVMVAVTVLVAWGIMFALRRTGTQRLERLNAPSSN